MALSILKNAPCSSNFLLLKILRDIIVTQFGTPHAFPVYTRVFSRDTFQKLVVVSDGLEWLFNRFFYTRKLKKPYFIAFFGVWCSRWGLNALKMDLIADGVALCKKKIKKLVSK